MEPNLRTSGSLSARPVTPSDAAEVMRVVNAAVYSDVELTLYRAGDLEKEWEGRPPDDLIAIEATGDGIVGFISFEAEGEGYYFEGFVDPEHEGRGIGTYMIDHTEDRARAETRRRGSPVRFETNVGSDRARAMFEDRGWEATVDDIAMFHDLRADLPAPGWSSDLTLRPYREDIDDRLMWDVMKAGFDDDWSPGLEPEVWIKSHREAYGYAEDLWFFAEKDGEVIGSIQCRETWRATEDTGWIKNLAVLPTARRSGAGSALVFEALHRFKERGRTRAVLGVHLNNPTRAFDFYVRIGLTPGTQPSADLVKTFDL